MKYSIIIPHTDLNGKVDLTQVNLKPCLESLFKYTDNNVEIIVVANGCLPESIRYIKTLPVVLIEIPEAVGYCKAVNAGIKAAKGEYLILLNNDVLLLPQSINEWIDILHVPFVDPNVAITGPLMLHDSYADMDALIFFCVMIRRSILNTLGLLDESYVSGGEDIDLCCRAQLAGYKIVRVPEDKPQVWTGTTNSTEFHIYHPNSSGTMRYVPEYGNVTLKVNGIKNYRKYSRRIVPEYEKLEIELKNISKKETVCVTVSTKGRTKTTLPVMLFSILNQTYKPDKLIIYDDNEESSDPRNDIVLAPILKLFEQKGIPWYWTFGSKSGQVKNHIKALSEAGTDLIFRCDDDVFYEADTLARLMSRMLLDVGAVGPLVLNPSISNVPSPNASGRIEDILVASNVQWHLNASGEVLEVDHLHCTFLFRRELIVYPTDFSPVGHREESWATFSIKRKGHKVLVDTGAISWHARCPTGGIRDGNRWFYEHDEKLFVKYLEECGVNLTKQFVAYLCNGIGDHLMFLKILPEIREKHQGHKIVLGVAYPEVFAEEKDIVLLSLKDVENMGIDIDKYNIYQYCASRKWDKHLIEAYREMYL